MLSSIWEDIRREYNYGNMITRIIIVNASVFVLINLVKVVLWMSNAGVVPGFYRELVHFFAMSSDYWHILTHPWVIITSMFLHEGLWHILINMLYLYWFGRIVGDFIGNHRILPLYLLGGLVGSVFFYISAQLLAYGGGGPVFALGASGGVMAIVMASAVLSPDYRMRLLLIGEVKLKYVVAVLIFLDIVGLASNINTGGHFAHIGGVAFGALFISALRSGRDLSAPINRLIQIITLQKAPVKKPSRPPKVPFMVFKNEDTGSRRRVIGEEAPKEDDFQHRLDSILEKIKAKGYDSLTQEEKEFLFQASKK